MERAGNKLIILALLFCSLNLNASYKSEIYSAYINNNMLHWKKIIDHINSLNQKSEELLLELVNYQYGYIAWCIGNEKEDDAKKYLSEAEKNLEVLSSDGKLLSIISAYRAAFYGYKIGLNKLLAPFLGMKSIDCAKLAISSDKENPAGYIQYGNIQFYMPAIFGGSKKEAVEYYLKAEELMEKNANDTTENWNYLSLLIVIAQSYYYIKDFQSSLRYLEKILKKEPDFGYVKNELYPHLLNKMKEKL